MKSSFNELGISLPILKAIEEMGFETPTEVQSKAIPHILNNEDLIVMSKTGSGKTAVFGTTMLQMTDPQAPGPQGLVLVPTRELAVQVDSDLKQLSKHLPHQTAAVYGQHSMSTEIQALKKGVSIVTGTPGRVFDHIQHGNIITRHIHFLVLDEADRMLDMGFLEQVVRIIRTIPKDRVTLLCSATMPPEIHRICRDYMKHPVTVEIESQTKTVDTTEQAYYRVKHNEKNLQLNRLLLIERPESCMIFCNTRLAVDRVQSFLTRKGYASQALHGDIPQSRRMKTIEQFKSGEFHLLVATDVAARGIHIEGLSLVINYDVPNEKDSYVHRIGRTGRAGKAGRAITLVTGDDIISLYEIEEHIGAMIAEAELPSEADYQQHKAEADEWVQANLLKEKPRNADTAAGGKQSGQDGKEFRSGRREPRSGRRDAQPGSRAAQPGNRSPKPGSKEAQPSNSKPQPNNKETKRGSSQPYSNNRDIRNERKPKYIQNIENVSNRPSATGQLKPGAGNTSPTSAGGRSEHLQAQDTGSGKPLIKRILQRILGR